MARSDPQWIDSTIEQLALSMQNVPRHRVPIPPVLTDVQWAGLRTPTLFLAGENEVIYSAEKAVRRLKRAAPQVTAEIIPGAGHDLTFVQSAVVNDRILQFLKGQSEPFQARSAAGVSPVWHIRPATAVPAKPGGVASDARGVGSRRSRAQGACYGEREGA